MAYALYLGGVRYPVAPKAIRTKIKNQNETITLINDGEVNLLKTAGLTDISFDLLLPVLQVYPYAVYPNGFQSAAYYLEQLEKLKTGKEPVQFIVSRTIGHTVLWDTNMTVSLEDYEIKEDKGEGLDVVVSVSLKQYRLGSTKTITVKSNAAGKQVATVEKQRTTVGKQTAKTYTVKSGDTLSTIAKKQLQNSSQYEAIYQLNKDVIEAAAKAHGGSSSKNGGLIYPGTVLRLPD